jgi:hypothetical protein
MPHMFRKISKERAGILRTSEICEEIRLGECPFIDTGGLLTVNLVIQCRIVPGEILYHHPSWG